jgi:hypothetical protein
MQLLPFDKNQVLCLTFNALLEQTHYILRTGVGLGHGKCACLAQNLHFGKIGRL